MPKSGSKTILARWSYLCASVIICGQLALSQTPDAPKFEFADVHVSPKTTNQFMRTSPPRNGRYEIHSATMVDLIRIAYGFDPDKILGGPSWLEMNHYDVIAKVPPTATAAATPETPRGELQDDLKDKVQSLLADRFKLTVHKDTKPLPTYALTIGKKPLMKEADGTGDTGCRARSDDRPSTPGDGVGRLMMMGPDGKTTTISIGPGQIVEYNCRNMTMEAFVGTMRTMVGVSLGTNPVLDQTGLKGAWNFDLKYSMNLIGLALASGQSDRISFNDAIDKQLGLKLEEHPVPTPVIIVDSVEEKPTANPPGVAEALPPIEAPTEFEVADVKPSDPGAGMGGFRMQPGGRLVSSGMPFSFLLMRAFNAQSNDQIVGMPDWVGNARFDITAKAPSSTGNLDMETVGPLLLSLLRERFGLKYHTEERTLPAYSLVAAKPKMKKADPTSRTHCTRGNAPAGSPPGSIMLTCQNTTMAQLAEQLRVPNSSIPPTDATGIEGGWDFTLTWSQRAGMMPLMARPTEGAPPAGDAQAASDPTGGFTIFEAVEKQLGLKLEMQKRPVPVFVIDHLDQKPTDN